MITAAELHKYLIWQVSDWCGRSNDHGGDNLIGRLWPNVVILAQEHERQLRPIIPT